MLINTRVTVVLTDCSSVFVADVDLWGRQSTRITVVWSDLRGNIGDALLLAATKIPGQDARNLGTPQGDMVDTAIRPRYIDTAFSVFDEIGCAVFVAKIVRIVTCLDFDPEITISLGHLVCAQEVLITIYGESRSEQRNQQQDKTAARMHVTLRNRDQREERLDKMMTDV